MILKKIVLTILLYILFYSPPVFSAGVVNVQPISFGGIIASPLGGIIEIDARSGMATPSVLLDGNSILDSNGQSGRIRVLSDKPRQTITLFFPDSVLLQKLPSGPDTIRMDRIADRSMTSEMSTAAGELIDFYIGGRLFINRGQSGLYEGTMTITVDIHNP